MKQKRIIPFLVFLLAGGWPGNINTVLGQDESTLTTAYYGYEVQSASDGGYVIAGYSKIIGSAVEREQNVWLLKTNSVGQQDWIRSFGGKENDRAYAIKNTNDSGYIILGETHSYGQGSYDVWLIKTDSNGNEEWNRTFGGSGWDQGYSLDQTTDGGYIITGYTYSTGKGKSDLWLIKTDLKGNQEWQKTFGGGSWDQGYSVEQTVDGGYIVAGETYSFGSGSYAVWLIKTDSTGNEEWSRVFGGTKTDKGFDAQQTKDGGYIITGYTYSVSAGMSDLWLIKTDSVGNEEWNRTFGGKGNDQGFSVIQTIDGGFALTGFTESLGQGYKDVWVIKTDLRGNEEWSHTFGGYNTDWAFSIEQTADRGYIISGYTKSFGSTDARSVIWIIKLNSRGEEEWNMTHG